LQLIKVHSPPQRSIQVYSRIKCRLLYVSNIETGFFFADVFNLVEQRLSDPNTPKPAWNAAGLIMTPDGLVTIEARLYDFETGVNLAPSTENIVCALGAGVTFFRYP
jgi:hypothetical protein